MNFLIFGKNSWIGNAFKEYLLDAGQKVEMSDKDIRGMVEIDKNVDVVVNCAAMTDIDMCEKKKVQCFQTNVDGALNLAGLCKDKKYVFFSSACIFRSYPEFANPEEAKTAQYFVEGDTPNPKCFYTETKVMAEKLIQEVCPDALIIRPRLPISEKQHPRNTLNKLLTYEKLNENQESITVIEDMFVRILELVNTNEKGIFHLVNEGTMSPKEIGEKLGHIFRVWSKSEQDQEMRRDSRATRVTSYIGSNRTSLLPDIRERIDDVIEKFKNPKKETKVVKEEKKSSKTFCETCQSKLYFGGTRGHKPDCKKTIKKHVKDLQRRKKSTS